jgi:single-strand DNA-binding protein
MSLAEDSRRDENGTRRTNWHLVHVFGNQAETAIKFLRKGRQVLVEGHIENTKTDKDGKTEYHSFITADHVVFLGPKPAAVDLAEERAASVAF